MEAKSTFSEKIEQQFNVRSAEFDMSASWITDPDLIRAHVDLAGEPCGEALDLCCGTGRMGRALKSNGWDVTGLDISPGMLKISSEHFPAFQGMAHIMPFESDRFHTVVCRQTFQFLDIKTVVAEIKRVLLPEGVLVLSLTVPFSDADAGWLREIHQVKQPLLLKFYTDESLLDELNQSGLTVQETKTLSVRESIDRWMQYAPELTQEVKGKVCSMVENAPAAYKKLHNVEVDDGEVFEDWNWIVIKTNFRTDN